MRTTSKSYQELFPPKKPRFYTIPLSSVCNSKCKFCFEKGNPIKFEKVGFRPPEEIYREIDSLDTLTTPFLLGGTASGRYGNLFNGKTNKMISWGEPLIHPQIFDILSHIRNKFDNPFSVYTNGTMLTEDFIKRLVEYKPINVGLSFSTINKDKWKDLYGMSDKAFDTVFNSIELLRKYNIPVFPSMITMTSIFNYAEIEETIAYYVSKGIESIIIYSPTYTKLTEPEVVKKMEYSEKELSEFIKKIEQKYSISLRWDTNPDNDLDVDYGVLKRKINELYTTGVRESYWLTSIAAYDRFKKIINTVNDKEDFQINVIKVKNEFFGGNVRCCGLWMLDDVQKTIEDYQLSNKHIVFPGIFLDEHGYDMNDGNVIDFINKNSNNKFYIVNE